MTATPPVRSADGIVPGRLRSWLSVFALGLGVFAFTTSEMVPIGLLTTMGSDLGVSEGSTGLAVTLYGVVAGLFAPVLTAATRRLDRRTLLLAVLAVFVIGNAVTALSVSYPLMLGSRFMTGFAHGVMWSIAASIAVRLVSPKASVRAIAVVFSGISVASVVGVPFGTFLGDAAGWRTVFWVISGLGVAVAVAVATLLSRMEPAGAVVLRDLPALLRSTPALRIAVLVTAVMVTGHFAAYTYVTPFLEQVTGIKPAWISGLLLLYGAAGVLGNFLSGFATARALPGTIIVCALGLGVSVALMIVVGDLTAPAIALLLAWGLFYTALPVALQTLVFSSAPDTPEAATSLFVMAFNVSIALGAAIGGLTIDASGPTATMLVGAVLALIAAGVMAAGRRAGSTTPSSVDESPNLAGR